MKGKGASRDRCRIEIRARSISQLGRPVRVKRLGKTELRCSELGFGCSRIASLSTASSQTEVAATIEEALDRSISFFDTADVYGQGDSERMLGRLLRGKRDRVILCTKAGLRVRAAEGFVRPLKPLVNPLIRRWRAGRNVAVGIRRQAEGQCFDPAHIRKQIEGSLRRLKTDFVDLFLLHNPPVEILMRDDVFALLEQMSRAGDIRYYGVSCGTPREAEAAMHIEGISCLQIEVNPLVMTTELQHVLRQARQADVGVIAREPLAGGVLSSPVAGGQVNRGVPTKRLPAEIALRSVAQRDDVGVVVVGMTNRRHLRENFVALDGPPVSAEEIAHLTEQQVGNSSAP